MCRQFKEGKTNAQDDPSLGKNDSLFNIAGNDDPRVTWSFDFSIAPGTTSNPQ